MQQKNITGYYKPAVLLALYNSAKNGGEPYKNQPSLFFTIRNTPSLTLQEAEKFLENSYSKYIDYVKGKKIAVSFETDDLHLGIYIREHGENAAVEAFNSLEEVLSIDGVHLRGFKN